MSCVLFVAWESDRALCIMSFPTQRPFQRPQDMARVHVSDTLNPKLCSGALVKQEELGASLRELH